MCRILCSVVLVMCAVGGGWCIARSACVIEWGVCCAVVCGVLGVVLAVVRCVVCLVGHV